MYASRVGRQRQPIFFFLASARLAPIVTLASTSFANPAPLLLAVVLVRPLSVRLAEWVPPVGGALSRYTSTWEVHATGGTQARPGGAPKQAAEAMPSSRGDARAADRARTQGGGGGIGRTPLGVCVFPWYFEGLAASRDFVETTIGTLRAPASRRARVTERPSATATGALAQLQCPQRVSTTPACSYLVARLLLAKPVVLPKPVACCSASIGF
jgi:hypothetical protein